MNELTAVRQSYLSFDSPDIRQTLLQFQKDDFLCDTVIISSDGQLRAHAIVLAAASKVFKSFLKPRRQSEECTINLPGVDSRALEAVIRFAYTGDAAALKEYACLHGYDLMLKIINDLGLLTTSHEPNQQWAPDMAPKPEIDCGESNDGSTAASRLKPSRVIAKQFDRRLWQPHSSVNRKRSGLLRSARKISEKETITFEISTRDCEESRESAAVNIASGACDNGCRRENRSASADVVPRQPSYSCSECRKEFPSLASLGQHRRVHLKADRPHVCPDCGRRFAQPESLVTHQQHHASEKPQRGAYVKPLSCAVCSLRFSSKLALGLHTIRRHANELGSSLCPVCDKDVDCAEADVSNAVLRHVADHMPFRCEFCGQVFIFQHPFQLHRLVHTNDRPHICETCGKSFKSRTEVARHRRVHTDEKRFICTTCGRRFNEAGNLTRHMRIHVALKPFACSICGRRMQEANYFKQHMWRHTGEKPHSCQLCDKSYKTRAYLRFHSRSVHKIELPTSNYNRPTKLAINRTESSDSARYAMEDS